MASPSVIPVIDISPLLPLSSFHSCPAEAAEVVRRIGAACREVGFFYISHHGISIELQRQLDAVSAEYFSLSNEEKSVIAMEKAGKAWRGSFLIGDEVTSGIVDQKEGLYFGSESKEVDVADVPLHGRNQWPPGELGQRMQIIVTEYMKQLTSLGTILISAIAASLSLTPADFGDQFTSPTTLFRIFHYPPHNSKYGENSQAVGEHTDYGYITILRQDNSGGLQVRDTSGEWIDAPPVENTFVINLGDAIEHNTGGLLRATPHRVAQRVNAVAGRYSFPFFYDPSFSSRMTSVYPLLSAEDQIKARENRQLCSQRWDKRDPSAFEGTYGEYLVSKVARVFPKLARQVGLLSADTEAA